MGIGGLVEIDGLDSWQQGAEMVRQGCACLQRVLHGATRPEKAKGASVGAYGASVVSWMFPKKIEKACFVHVAFVPFTKSGALFKNLLKELCWDSAGVATSDSTDSMTLGTGR